MADLSNVPTDQLLQMLHSQAAQAQAAPAPQPSQRDAGIAAGASESTPIAALGQAAHNASFGLEPYVDAAAQYARDRLTGKPNAASYSDDLAYARGQSEGEIGAHQVAGTVGGVVGGLAGGGALGTALKGTRVLRALGGIEGQPIRNVVKSAVVNGALGSGTAAAEGQDTPEVAQTGLISAVAGPVIQKAANGVISFGLKKLAPASQAAYRALGDAISETPQTLQNAYDTFVKLTGRVPSLAEIMGLKSQGKLRDLAEVNPTISEAAQKAADAANLPLHEQLAQVQNAVPPGATAFPQGKAGLSLTRGQLMSDRMAAPTAAGIPLRDTPVSLSAADQASLQHPLVTSALRTNTARLGPDSLRAKIDTNTLTLDDLDAVRETMRNTQDVFANNQSAVHNRPLASAYGDMANKVEGIGRRAAPDYGKALDTYKEDSRYLDGFSHGVKGGAGNPDTAPDEWVARSLKTPEGQEGYEHGNALYTAQRALNTIAPGRVTPPANVPNAGHVTQAAMAIGAGGVTPFSIAHTLRAIPVVGQRVPQAAQEAIARQLFDPRTTQQGINNLVRAGAQAKDIRAVGAAIGGAAGQRIADYLSQKGQ